MDKSNTINHHVNLFCLQCKSNLGLALTLTQVRRAYINLSMLCDNCGHRNSHSKTVEEETNPQKPPPDEQERPTVQ